MLLSAPGGAKFFFAMKKTELTKAINKLKKQKKAVVLVHNYQRPEFYDIADYIGDSLQLCRQAQQTDAEIILFCGVHFMAESAAILNPNKKVLVPCLDAGCPMADMIEAGDLRDFKKKHPGAAVVCYVNSSAEVKALSDICCTSANCVDVVKSLNEKDIIFVPDKNLAYYVQSRVPEKNIIAYKGFCPVHHVMTRDSLKQVIDTYPKSKIIAHPECRPEVLEMADYISSTTGMIRCAAKDDHNDFFIVTECGMIERLKKELPGKKFYGVCNICFDMKKNTLEAALKALQNEKPRVFVEKKVLQKAKKAFERMFEVV